MLTRSYGSSEITLSKAPVEQYLKTVRGSQDILCYFLDSQSQGDPVLVTAQDKKHLDQKKHKVMQNTKLKQKIKASAIYNTKLQIVRYKLK